MSGHGDKCWCKLGVAAGLAWALGIFLMGVAGAMIGYGMPMIDLFGSVYLGYEATLMGSLIGAVWAFFDMFIFVLIIGLFYCLVSKCCSKCCKKSHCDSE
ncbi:MAG TPA: hypothetical protein EYQ43_03295 [Methyloprofundus sp.]|uniref:hypothetical protein n=1 Tax=Methyloprofundus sp. TaxID=2020875 RepID=UPI0017D9F970|nr:hypothetical protein [Methyloprofundus sp.]HIG64592.1 hypothetical protein [Methyloprofundus sp.]HIL78479.1 hypothetical protein [Methylococcales bacterium]